MLWIINNDINVNNDFRGNVIAIRNVSKKILVTDWPIISTATTSTQKNSNLVVRASTNTGENSETSESCVILKHMMN